MPRRSNTLLRESEHVMHYLEIRCLSGLIIWLVLAETEPSTRPDLLCSIELIVLLLELVRSLLVLHHHLLVIALMVTAISVNVMLRLSFRLTGFAFR